MQSQTTRTPYPPRVLHDAERGANVTATAQPKTPKRASVAAVAGRVRPVLDEHSKAALKAMRQARDFPANTCAGSRHAALMAEHLIRRGPLPMLTDEPRHCGESIAHTVAALWVARTEIERLRDLLRLVADEPNIDKARALADRELHGPNVRGEPVTTAKEKQR